MESRHANKVILIGFMGTGKSSVSKLLAERLDRRCIDSDDEIVSAQQRTISEIFEQDGEEAFRSIESEVLSNILRHNEPAIVATGGGAVLKPSNRDIMLESGFVVALQANPEHIIARVTQDPTRPLLKDDVRSRVYSLMEERKRAYDFAHLRVDTTELTVEQVVNYIINQWKLWSLITFKGKGDF